MTKNILIFLCCILCFVIQANAQYTQIPDPNFEAALSSLDNITGDGQIPTSNIESLTALNVANKNINSLSGIEDFTSLKQLTANDNLLTSIDITNLLDLEELILYNNQITSIDLSNNPNLKEIDFYNNQLSSLDISQNTALVNVFIDGNSITSIDATENTFLERLDVSNNNLSSLNIKNGNNTKIKGISVTGNTSLTCIIVDDSTYAATNFNNVDSGIRFITTSCDYISIPDANFEAALSSYDDISGDGQVPIENIQNVTSLSLDNLNISSLSGIEYFKTLTILKANGNALTIVDVTSLVELRELELSENQITTIDLTKNVKLQRINFYNNLLSSIDLTKNILLRRVFVDSNSISEIDLTVNTLLEKVDVSNNKLTSFKLKNENNISINSFAATGNSNLKCILVDDVTFAQINFTNIDEGVAFSTVNCNYTAIPDANLEAALDGLGYDDFLGDGQVPTYLISEVKSLNLVDKNIVDATGIEAFVALEELNIYSNSLTILDVNTNTRLKHLRCQNNEIASLNVTSNVLLETLISDNNPLTSLDLSKNPLLNNINISNTSIRTIDVSNNTGLTVLTAEQTELLSLDLSQNSLLKEVSLINGKFIFINLKNGGNTNVTDIYFDGNTSLTCVSVDDLNYAITNWTDIDDANVFSTAVCTLAYTSIPDVAFETRLFDLGYDDISGDGQVPTKFIEKIISLDLSKSTLTDLSGIEKFTSLEVLTVSSTTLKTLNLSGNSVIKEVYADPSGLETINVSNMEALEILHSNQAHGLTSINLTGATNLKELSLYSSIGLESIDVSTNSSLERLIAYQSTITSLNTTGATNLKELVLYNNGSLTSLDVSTNIFLEKIDVNSSGLSLINTTGAVALKELYVHQTKVTELDISSNAALTTLHCYNNGSLVTINNSGALTIKDLQCQNTSITSLDLSTNINLSTLNCSNTSLVSLDIRNGNNTSIINFDASSNSTLNCIMVDDISFATINFTNIDNGTSFSTNTCGYTLIPDANFEAALSAYDDVSADGKIPSANIEAIFRLRIDEKSISDLTGIEDFVGLEQLYCGNNNLTSIDLSKNINLKEFNAAVNSITEIDLSKNEKLEIAIINRNSLTTIDVTQNSQLKRLSIWNNNISEIDITQNTHLESLNAFGLHNLTTIDVSKNSELKELDVSDCAVTSIDVSNNLNLTEIYIYNNNITSIDLSNNLLLKYVYISNNAIGGYLDMSTFESLVDFEAINCGLTALNLKNGNNATIDYIDISGNTNLTCIQVDDATYSTTNWTNVDNKASYNEDCGYNFSVSPKIILEGAFEVSSENILMHDNLRDNTSILIPSTSPYNNETCETTIFDTTGENAVVDWIEVQLRNANNITQIITTKSALLLRNGNVVDTDGTSPVEFSQVQGNFYLAIAHRNHLTTVTNTPNSFTSLITAVDFTNTTNVLGGSSALINLGDDFNGIPLGDIDKNGQVQNADISNTVQQIGISGYSVFDVDMNGQVQNADVNLLLKNVGKGEQF